MPAKQRKRRRIGPSEERSVRLRAARPNHVWSYDFLFDQTEEGRTLKLMPVVDEYTREYLALVIARSITSSEVAEVLGQLIEEHGESGHVRSDNGPEWWGPTSKSKGLGRVTLIQERRGRTPTSKASGGKLRDKLFRREIFGNLLEAKVLSGQYHTHYNHERPHSALSYQTRRPSLVPTIAIRPLASTPNPRQL